MNDLTLAYLAGFFDGEGSVYIIRHRRKNGRPDQYSLEISFTGSDATPLELAKSVFGGQITVCVDKRGKNKPVSRLRIRSKQAASALTAMLPFMMVKGERAAIGIEFQGLLSGPMSNRRKSNISIELSEQYKAKITAMNDAVWNSGVLVG